MSTSSAPEARQTRGKTAPNRLRQADAFVCAWKPGLFMPRGPMDGALVVDLGYGRAPQTTIELAHRLWEIDPSIPVLGVERERERVEQARPSESPGLEFRQGDFELPMKKDERVRLIRAMNVLRQYPEEAARPAIAQLVSQLMAGGLLVEGTCHPFGQVMVAGLHGRSATGEQLHHGLLFATNFKQGFEPGIFKPVLPKHLIHRVVPGEPIHAFFAHWERAAAEASSAKSFGLRQHFVATAERLGDRVEGLELRERWLRRGWLFWAGAPY